MAIMVIMVIIAIVLAKIRNKAKNLSDARKLKTRICH